MRFKINKKVIRYCRWSIKAFFLFIFTVPLTLILKGQTVEVRSFFSTQLISRVPITQSPDSIWLSGYGNVDIGFWILEPFGGLQVLLTGFVESHLFVPTVAAVLLFMIPIALLGNFFCSWACPIGAVIDSFDMLVGKSFPKIENSREKRRKNLRKNVKIQQRKILKCLPCPLYGTLTSDKDLPAKGIAITALVATVFARFPVFCVICPIGIISRGMIHLKSIKTALHIGGKELILWIETFTMPMITVTPSLRERRYWCKHLCPVGTLLNAVGVLSPFLKPRVDESKCVMYVCPDKCKDYQADYCGVCRLMDDKKCEQVCPANINLTGHGSLFGCTKCLECYVSCEYEAIKIDNPKIVGFVRKLLAKIF
jgi:ferredoxin-type protein NapH